MKVKMQQHAMQNGKNVVARYMDNTFGSFGRIFEGGIWVWVRIGAPMDPASSK